MDQVGNNRVPEEDDDVPFGPPGEEYLYRCSACGEEGMVDDVIVDAAVGMAPTFRTPAPNFLNNSGEKLKVSKNHT